MCVTYTRASAIVRWLWEVSSVADVVMGTIISALKTHLDAQVSHFNILHVS